MKEEKKIFGPNQLVLCCLDPFWSLPPTCGSRIFGLGENLNQVLTYPELEEVVGYWDRVGCGCCGCFRSKWEFPWITKRISKLTMSKDIRPITEHPNNCLSLQHAYFEMSMGMGRNF